MRTFGGTEEGAVLVLHGFRIVTGSFARTDLAVRSSSFPFHVDALADTLLVLTGTVAITNIVVDATIKYWHGIYTSTKAKEVVGWKNLDCFASLAFNEISVEVVVRFLVPARAHITVLFAPFPCFVEPLAFFARVPGFTREGTACLQPAPG